MFEFGSGVGFDFYNAYSERRPTGGELIKENINLTFFYLNLLNIGIGIRVPVSKRIAILLNANINNRILLSTEYVDERSTTALNFGISLMYRMKKGKYYSE